MPNTYSAPCSTRHSRPYAGFLLIALLYIFVLPRTSSAQLLSDTQNVDLTIGGVERLEYSTPDAFPNTLERTTAKPGLFVALSYHPTTYFGLQLSAEALHESEHLDPTFDGQQTFVRQYGAAYLLHSRFRTIQPFIAIGASYQQFAPRGGAQAQHRPSANVNVGADIPLIGQHLGLSLQAHSAWYRAFAETASRQWTGTVEPTAGFYLRF